MSDSTRDMIKSLNKDIDSLMTLLHKEKVKVENLKAIIDAWDPVCVAHGCMQQRHFVSIRKLQAEIERLTEPTTRCGKAHKYTVGKCLACDNERLRSAVSEQAEDDGLWFIAETAPEAYLQNALRYLHALIEQDARALAALNGVETDE